MTRMTNKKTDRLNIQDFLFSVRFLSLFFAAIAFLQFAYWQVDAGAEFASYVWYVPLAAIAIAAAIYLCLFNLRRATKRQQRWGKALECGLMLGVFFFAIAVTGLWESQYKILFLFLIISYTFESGMRVGLGLAAFCSLAVLAIDAVWAPTQGGVNLQMQNDLLLCGAFIVTAWALGFYSQIRQEYIASLEKQVRVDGLTGLLNHRSFYDAVQADFERAVREDQPLSLIFADVDYFKTYNDCHGHQAGDAALVAMAGLFTQLLGDGKQIFRYGGEEFSLILPGVGEEEARALAERLRAAVEEHPFPGEEVLPGGRLTISCGVAARTPQQADYKELVHSGDDALYRAKFFRKNRVEVYVSLLEQFPREGGDGVEEALASIRALIAVVNSRDMYTFGHTERVVYYADMMARQLALPPEEAGQLVYAAYVHDVGKINIPKEVLLKPIGLTDEEWGEMKRHPEEGAYILQNLPSLAFTAELVRHHHERYDGSGYPDGLKGEEIPYLSRVLTLVDSFDAILSDRPYKKGRTFEEGIVELVRCRGTQFDPALTDQFIEALRTVR